MKIVYFDCFAGISADMVLGALIDVGLNPELLKSELERLNLKSGWNLEIKKMPKGVIVGTKVEVTETTHQYIARPLKEIIELIDNSNLEPEIKVCTKNIFLSLGKVEADIHNTRIEEVHLHEVGSLASIIKVVGTVVGIKRLGIEEIQSSPLHIGSGFVECAHGILPLPSPATAKLLINIPVYSLGYEGELVTPTGAAIITTLANRFGSIPLMKIEGVGYGVGSKDLKIPHLIRIFVGQKVIVQT